MKPWRLAELRYPEVRDAGFEVAVLPFGATEPHNHHLPYGTDVFEADLIGDVVCGAAMQGGARVVLLPTIPYGTQTNMRELPLAMNLNPSTLTCVVADLVETLVGSGIRKVVLLNCHGGNGLKPMLRELDGIGAHLFLCNFWEVIADSYDTIFEKPEDHAGEMETSLALAFFRDTVARHPDGTIDALDGSVRPHRFDAVERGWVRITRPWDRLTESTGSADPRAATPEKGRDVLDLLIKRLAPFLIELSNAEIDGSFPFEPGA